MLFNPLRLLISGLITLAVFGFAGSKALDAFDQADDNKDGKLDSSEFLKAEAIHERMVTGKYVEDSVITTKVKAALLKEPKLKSMDVSVETYNGEVLLSGFVRDESQREAAKKVATRVSGVTSVKDAMVVRN